MLRTLRRLLGETNDEPSELAAYRRLRAQGFAPDRIIDVGAYEGNWTRLARQAFAGCPVLMVEAQASKLPALQQFCAQTHGLSVVGALLAEVAGKQTVFYEMETGSSMRAENSNVDRIERHLVTSTLDDVAGPDGSSLFLKIDVQGAELDVLAGGHATIARCGAIQLETALLPYNKDAPLITEVLVRMQDLGFLPLDFAGFIRPKGIDLVQVDIIFVPKDSPLRKTTFIY